MQSLCQGRKAICAGYAGLEENNFLFFLVVFDVGFRVQEYLLIAHYSFFNE